MTQTHTLLLKFWIMDGWNANGERISLPVALRYVPENTRENAAEKRNIFSTATTIDSTKTKCNFDSSIEVTDQFAKLMKILNLKASILVREFEFLTLRNTFAAMKPTNAMTIYAYKIRFHAYHSRTLINPEKLSNTL